MNYNLINPLTCPGIGRRCHARRICPLTARQLYLTSGNRVTTVNDWPPPFDIIDHVQSLASAPPKNSLEIKLDRPIFHISKGVIFNECRKQYISASCLSLSPQERWRLTQILQTCANFAAVETCLAVATHSRRGLQTRPQRPRYKWSTMSCNKSPVR